MDDKKQKATEVIFPCLECQEKEKELQGKMYWLCEKCRKALEPDERTS